MERSMQIKVWKILIPAKKSKEGHEWETGFTDFTSKPAAMEFAKWMLCEQCKKVAVATETRTITISCSELEILKVMNYKEVDENATENYLSGGHWPNAE